MVEVAPTASVGENLDWLDYLAVDLEMANLPQLDALLDIQNLPFEGQVLVRIPMPCRGIGECGVCAVKTHHGWKLACTDGPVFDLQEVLHVA
jgi:dihydroorotate dehydrogenase electron transfer subunit